MTDDGLLNDVLNFMQRFVGSFAPISFCVLLLLLFLRSIYGLLCELFAVKTNGRACVRSLFALNSVVSNNYDFSLPPTTGRSEFPFVPRSVRSQMDRLCLSFILISISCSLP